MFETNIQNNSSLISLARAAEITGYHQDYLGQLCRLGRLPAKKVGRNWFTSTEALDSLTNQVDEQPEPQETQAEIKEVTDLIKELKQQEQPVIAQTITISQVEGLPIAIQTVPAPVHATNNVQSIATNLRIQALQREVTELRNMLMNLMVEVSRHTDLLKNQNFADIWRRQDSLRHNYVSNFDFNSAYLQNTNPEVAQEKTNLHHNIFVDDKPKFALVTWISAVATVALVAFIATGVITGSFWGTQPTVKTVYYHSHPQTPRVAGDSTTQIDQTLPTAGSSETPVNVVK